MSYEVFISYSSEDTEDANSVYAILEKNGIRCWIAHRNITPGLQWRAVINEAIGKCKVMILIFSAHADRSHEVQLEVERAISKQLLILPFRVEQVEPSGALSLGLGGTHRLDGFRPPKESRREELVDAVIRLLGKERETAVQESPSLAINPAVRVRQIPFIAILFTSGVLLLAAIGIWHAVTAIPSGSEAESKDSNSEEEPDKTSEGNSEPLPEGRAIVGIRVKVKVDQASGFSDKDQMYSEIVLRGMTGTVKDWYEEKDLCHVLRDEPNGDKVWISRDHLQRE